MGYKFDLLQLKQGVFWNFTYSRSETNNAWKIALEVIKYVYFHPTLVLSAVIIGLNITCTKFWILWICTVPTSYLKTISTQNMTRAKWLNTRISYPRFCTFIRPVRHEEKSSQKKLWIWLAAAWANFLVVSTFATRCLHMRKAGRDPSGEKWNCLRGSLSLNLP